MQYLTLGAIGLAMFAVGMHQSMRIEQTAGYYECPSCGHRYVPSLRSVYLAPHIGRSRLMRCPKCGERHYQRKVLLGEDGNEGRTDSITSE